MIRENQRYFNRLQVFLDLILIPISFILAYGIRFHLMDDGIVSIGIRKSMEVIILSIPFFFIFYNLFDIYSSRRT